MYTHISFREREKIGLLRAARKKVPEIARRLNRDPTSIRREIKRSKPFFLGYSPLTAQADARKKQKALRRKKKLDHLPLWRAVRRKLGLRWSPEQIAHWLKATYPEDTHMQVSS